MTRSDRVDLPDLVRDTELAAEIHDDGLLTVHTWRWSRSKRELWKRRPKPIGSGGYGLVWLEQEVDQHGRVKQTSRLRAVKQIRTNQPGMTIKECFRELEAVAKFSQVKFADHFVRSFGWYEGPESLYLAMEFCEWGDLKAYVARQGALSEVEARTVTRQILVGIAHMHEENFAHRDLKPANVLIVSCPPDDWIVKLSDFGLTKRSLAGDSTTVKGTLSFLAPELLGHGNRKCDPMAGDIWSAGESSYFLLTGKSAFEELAVRMRYVKDPAVFPTKALKWSGASSTAKHFVRELMAAQPSARPSAAEALSHAWISVDDEPAPPVPLVTTGWPEAEVVEASASWSTASLAQPEQLLGPDSDATTQEREATAPSESKTFKGIATDAVSPISSPKPTHTDGQRDSENGTDTTLALQIAEPVTQGVLLEPRGQPVSDRQSTDQSTRLPTSYPAPDCSTPLTLTKQEMRIRPSHIPRASWPRLVNSVVEGLAEAGLGFELPGLRDVVTLLESNKPNGPYPALAMRDTLLLAPAKRFVELYTRCDATVLLLPSTEFKIRSCACIVTLSILLRRGGSKLEVQDRKPWVSWTDPKLSNVREWEFWATNQSLSQCQRCPVENCSGSGQADWQCFSCLNHFCVLHREEDDHVCKRRGSYSRHEYHEIRKLLLGDDCEKHTPRLKTWHEAFRKPKVFSHGTVEKMDKDCIRFVIEHPDPKPRGRPFDPVIWKPSADWEEMMIETVQHGKGSFFRFTLDHMNAGVGCTIKQRGADWCIKTQNKVSIVYLNDSRLSTKFLGSAWTTLQHGDRIQVVCPSAAMFKGSLRAIWVTVEFETPQGAMQASHGKRKTT